MTKLLRISSIAALSVCLGAWTSSSFAVESLPLPEATPANTTPTRLPQQGAVREFDPGQTENSELPLSPGDRVRIFISGLGGEVFNGSYEVNFNGSLELPLIAPLPVAGLVPQEVERQLSTVLVQGQFFRPELLSVSIQLLEFSPIQVTVIGETFDPGRILLDAATPSSGAAPPGVSSSETGLFPGDYSPDRYLTAVLKSAGGVRPNADLARIQLVRNGQTNVIDLSGLINDQPIDDVPLIAGDQIIVPDSGQFQAKLVRPSQVTPNRIPLFVSNLTAPGGSSGIKETEYGTRLSQALIEAQCIGGNSTNSRRKAVLVRTNTRTGESVTMQRSVEDLIKKSPSVGEEDPYLMPRDGIACYDSNTVNLRNVIDTIVNVIAPVNILRSIFR